MALLIGFAVASFAVAGLAIFLFRYRGTRARAAGVSAFALGLTAISVFILIHATVGPDRPVVWTVFFVTHLVMCMVELLLLGAVLSLRDPPSAGYRRTEVASGLVMAILAIVIYGGAAWWSPQNQDKVSRLVFPAIPLLIGVAIVARFGLARDGLVGGSAFLALFVGNLIYVFMNPYEQESVIIRTLADSLLMAGYLGMLVFFYLASSNIGLARTPWPGGSLKLNLARGISAGVLALGLAGCGYFLSNLLERGWLARWSSNYVPLSLLLPAAAFAGCLVGVFGLTTGRNLVPDLLRSNRHQKSAEQRNV
jgi:hypothetical protein